MRETRDQRIERLTKQLAGAYRRCDPADAATREKVAGSVARVRRLVDRLGYPLSDQEAETITAGVLQRLELEALWAPYRHELARDYVSLSELIRRVRRERPDLDERATTLEVLDYAIERGDAETGMFEDGKFVAREIDAAAEWDRLGREPNVGEVLWLNAPCPRRALPDTAFEFAREQLWLARGLEPHLHPLLSPERFAAFTLAPLTVDDERLARFAVGGAIGCTHAHYAEVRRALFPGARWIVPDPMGTPGDPFLARVDTPWLEVDDGIYYRGHVAQAWRAGASAAGQMGLVTTADDTLQAMAENARLIAMTAYDCEGTILFERR